MNAIILTVILLLVFFIIQKNSKFQDKNYPINKDNANKQDKQSLIKDHLHWHARPQGYRRIVFNEDGTTSYVPLT